MADTQNMALDQATEEHRFFDLYQKALKCGVYREAEYLCDLVLHEYAVKKPMPAVFKPLTSTAPLSRAFCESTNQQLLWQWRRYRALFLQQRYSVLLLELDQRFAEVFLCWAAARQSSKTIGPGTSWAQALYSTKEHTSLIFRCAFLKVLALVLFCSFCVSRDAISTRFTSHDFRVVSFYLGSVTKKRQSVRVC